MSGTSIAAAVLPPELAFLPARGVDRGALCEAVRLAAEWDVAPVDAALATDAVDPDRFYRALAAELGLPFLPFGYGVHPLARYPEAVLAGIAPLGDGEGASYVLAPRGEAVAGLLERRGAMTPGLAVSTPAALRDAIFREKGESIARRAAEQLARERPEHSYYDGISWRQVSAVLLAAALVALGVAAYGRPALLLAVLALGAPFLCLAAVKIAAVLAPAPVSLPPKLPRMADAELPIYTVLIPLYRERRVLAQIKRALLALDYPAARLDVKLLVESGDEETASGIRAVRWPGFVETVTVPPGVPRTKPRALNVGLALARGTFVVVYDAEDVPDPGQLRDAVSLFRVHGPDVACLQARLVIDNTSDSLLTRFFTVEYGGLFDVANPALAQFDLPMPLGGTSNHLKTEVLRALGGWDPWNVTEDADLGVRLALIGHRVADLPSSTHEEAPSTLRAWLAQRTRWMKGYVQVAIVHSRHPLRSLKGLGPWRFAGATLLIAGAVVSAAVYPVFTLAVLAQIATGEFFDHEGPLEVAVAALSLVLLVAGLAAMVLPGLAVIRVRGWWALWPFAFLMPLYYVLVSLGAWRGLWELIADPDRWNKTEHGLARTSRRTGAAPPDRESGASG